MKKYYVSGSIIHELPIGSSGDGLKAIREGFWYIGYVIGFTWAITIRFIAGFGIGLLIKALWCAIF